MKKTLIFTVAGLTIFLAGCTTQLPAQNQNNNQPAINQNIDLPTAETNQNINQPMANVNQATPTWIKALIDEIESKSWGNSPSTIKKCNYQDKIVYYITSPCCDNYNYLYNENNQVICAPDGGITGRGDGKCIDFSSDKKTCELIWQDSRSN